MWKWHFKGVSEGLRASSGTKVVKGRPLAGGGLKKKKNWGCKVRCWVFRRVFERRARNAGNASHEIFWQGRVAAGLEVIWCHLLARTPAPDMRTRWLCNGLTLTLCSVSNSKVVVWLKWAYFFYLCMVHALQKWNLSLFWNWSLCEVSKVTDTSPRIVPFQVCGMHIRPLLLAGSWNLRIFARGGQHERANALNKLCKAAPPVSGMKNEDVKMGVTQTFRCRFTSTLVWHVVIGAARVLAS